MSLDQLIEEVETGTILLEDNEIREAQETQQRSLSDDEVEEPTNRFDTLLNFWDQREAKPEPSRARGSMPIPNPFSDMPRKKPINRTSVPNQEKVKAVKGIFGTPTHPTDSHLNAPPPKSEVIVPSAARQSLPVGNFQRSNSKTNTIGGATPFQPQFAKSLEEINNARRALIPESSKQGDVRRPLPKPPTTDSFKPSSPEQSKPPPVPERPQRPRANTMKARGPDSLRKGIFPEWIV